MTRPSYTDEFKQDSANLVIEQNYSIPEAAKAVGVSESALRKWVKRLSAEYQGQTPSSGKAMTVEHQRIQELEGVVKRLQREKEILKKASALLMSDTLNR